MACCLRPVRSGCRSKGVICRPLAQLPWHVYDNATPSASLHWSHRQSISLAQATPCTATTLQSVRFCTSQSSDTALSAETGKLSGLSLFERITRLSSEYVPAAGRNAEQNKNQVAQLADVMMQLALNFDWEAVKLISRQPALSPLAFDAPSALEELTHKCLVQLQHVSEAHSPPCVLATMQLLGFHGTTTDKIMSLIRRVEPVLQRDMETVSSAAVLLRFLNTIGARYSRSGEKGASPELIWSVYRQLSRQLRGFAARPNKSMLVAVYNACDSMAQLQVREPKCLRAWEEYLAAVIAVPGMVRSVADLRAAARPFSHLRFEAPRLFHEINRLLHPVDNGLWSSPEQAVSTLSPAGCVHLCWSFLAQNMTPPGAAMRRIASLLQNDQISLGPAIAGELDQLLSLLPLPASVMPAVLQRITANDYIPQQARLALRPLIATATAGQVKGVHVMYDVFLSAGRVPLVAMVTWDGAGTLPWPDHCPPLGLTRRVADCMPGVPVAILFAGSSRVLPYPRMSLDGVLARQLRVLVSQGFRVSVILPFQLGKVFADAADGHDVVLRCIRQALHIY
eukprot:scpid66964/ scgid21680/ 